MKQRCYRARTVATFAAILCWTMVGLGGARARSQDFIQQAAPEVNSDGYVGGALASVNALIRLKAARRTFSLAGAAEDVRPRLIDGEGVTVAVVGTGLNTSHADFEGRITAARSFAGREGNDDIRDSHGVATHVSGIIVGRGGIAPRARVAPLKVADDKGAGDWRALGEALRFVHERGEEFQISVVLCCMHQGNYRTNPVERDEMRAIEEWVKRLREKRVVVVAPGGSAYGREGFEPGLAYPAIIPGVISVGAVYDSESGAREYQNGVTAKRTQPDQIAPYTQRLAKRNGEGEGLDILAPGGPISSSAREGRRGQSVMEGSSQAAAVVAGVIALMQQRLLQTTGTLPEVTQIEEALQAGAAPVIDSDDGFDNVRHTGETFPRLDAFGALQALRGSKSLIVEVGTTCPLDVAWNDLSRGERFDTSAVRNLYRLSGEGGVAALLVGGIPRHPAFGDRLVAIADTPAVVGDGCFAANIAGLIAADGEIAGAAPAARLVGLPARAEDGPSLDLETLDAALEWILEHGEEHQISVVVCPQHEKANYQPENLPGDGVYARIAEKILTLREKRVPVIASAGDAFADFDGAQGMSFPAILGETISVGALAPATRPPALENFEKSAIQKGPPTDGDKGAPALADFTQRLDDDRGGAHHTDIFAWGGPLVSIGAAEGLPSVGRGTSQGAACVAGVVLLIQEHYKRATGQRPTVDELERWLSDGGQPIASAQDNPAIQRPQADLRALDIMGALRATHREVEQKIIFGEAK